eukprot:4086161-Alexandrium_andersonii.AAC.1
MKRACPVEAAHGATKCAEPAAIPTMYRKPSMMGARCPTMARQQRPAPPEGRRTAERRSAPA